MEHIDEFASKVKAWLSDQPPALCQDPLLNASSMAPEDMANIAKLAKNYCFYNNIQHAKHTKKVQTEKAGMFQQCSAQVDMRLERVFVEVFREHIKQ